MFIKIYLSLLLVLLDTSVSMISVSSIVVLAVMSVIGFLLRDNYQSLKKRLDRAEECCGVLDDKIDKVERETNSKINDMYLNVLGRLDGIRDKFDQFRKNTP